MLAAGSVSASVLLRDHAHRLAHGVAVFAGSGNNGGDAYIVAAQLARAGVRVRIVPSAPPRTDDARQAESLARRELGTRLSIGDPDGSERLAVDGLLGTGHRGDIRSPVAERCEQLDALRQRGAFVTALDVPSGLDASTGDCATGAVRAHLTLSYGSCKRGLLIARAHAGRILVLDIGLGAHACGDDDAWQLANGVTLAERLPPIAWNAHKGGRGHLAIVGGTEGMVGAVVLATRAALASGIGLARAFVDDVGVAVMQSSVPQAITGPWGRPMSQSAFAGGVSVSLGTVRADALVIGPGLGRGSQSRALLRAALDAHPNAPVVLDADALTIIAEGTGNAAHRLREWCGTTRPVVCTPHTQEFARLIGRAVPNDWVSREEALRDFAARAEATVLLKGTPTLIASPVCAGGDGGSLGPVCLVAAPYGSAVLATGGSGDMLAGIIGTLLAQGVNAPDAALLGARVHGGAAEIVSIGQVRGFTLDDVMRALPQSWARLESPEMLPPGVLADYPALS